MQLCYESRSSRDGKSRISTDPFIFPSLSSKPPAQIIWDRSFSIPSRCRGLTSIRLASLFSPSRALIMNCIAHLPSGTFWFLLPVSFAQYVFAIKRSIRIRVSHNATGSRQSRIHEFKTTVAQDATSGRIGCLPDQGFSGKFRIC